MKNTFKFLALAALVAAPLLPWSASAQMVSQGTFIKTLGFSARYTYSQVQIGGVNYGVSVPNSIPGMSQLDLLTSAFHDVVTPQFGGALSPDLGRGYIVFVNAAGDYQMGIATTFVDGMSLDKIVSAYITAAASGSPLPDGIPPITQFTIDEFTRTAVAYKNMSLYSLPLDPSNIMIDSNGQSYVMHTVTGGAGTLEQAQGQLQQVMAYQQSAVSAQTAATGAFDTVNGSMAIADETGNLISASAADAILTKVAPSLGRDVAMAVGNGLLGLVPGILAQLELSSIVTLTNQDAQQMYQQGGVIDQICGSEPACANAAPADQLAFAMNVFLSGTSLSPVYSEPYAINVINPTVSPDPNGYLSPLTVVSGNTVNSPYTGLPPGIAGDQIYFSPYQTISVAPDGTITTQTPNGTTIVQVPIMGATAPDALGNEQPLYSVSQSNPDGSHASYVASPAFGTADNANTIVAVPGETISVLAGETTAELETTESTIDTLISLNDDSLVDVPSTKVIAAKGGLGTGACPPGTSSMNIGANLGANVVLRAPVPCAAADYMPPKNPPGGNPPKPAATASSGPQGSSGSGSGSTGITPVSSSGASVVTGFNTTGDY